MIVGAVGRAEQASQESYLATLAREADAELPDDLTKAEASKQIDELQAETGRGR